MGARMKNIILAAAALLAFSVRSSPSFAFADSTPPYFVDESQLPFEALPGTSTERFWGIEARAGYQIEVPQAWNGKLVLYAHGFRARDVLELTVTQPRIRRFLVENGYAWAASSYSTNGYDVKRGVLDTHALNVVFEARVGQKPATTFITGHSMGGHITGVLIDLFPDAYVGALPMCGVMGDVALFDYFLDYNLVAHALAGVEAEFPPRADYQSAVVPTIRAALGGSFPLDLNEQGEKLRAVTELISGGVRPSFNDTFPAWGNFLFTVYGDGTLSGVASGNVATNVGTVYRFAPGEDLTPEEQELNDSVLRVEADWMARFFHGDDNLENVPPIQAIFQIPVLSLHTIGDLFVPFSMEQIYAERADGSGRSDLLVQR